ncbi:hypothetical protein AWJ20_739 [Sugiyamaella lignohabitans]|uniref:RecQ mediated genome instability protein 1 OB-fold domain-containing protein n=1 Tax=Sugiyamaella lignohabitans TaxID=796027 RepID=A0A167D4X9_9ASCO|nr:uncharacterized protein AWJ20_739 [Sugiyamaella lignohabitans]ANB12483.1 hypothetical protein AWJ20_739 [Sugiyamaella lignohabitans]
MAIDNISASKYSQIQALTETAESASDRVRGARRRRMVTRVQDDSSSPADDGSNGSIFSGGTGESTNSGGNGLTGLFESPSAVHKLTLQDTAGTAVYAIELDRIDTKSITAISPLGAKLLLLGSIETVRNVLMLKKSNVQVLGGTIPGANSTPPLAKLQASLPS